MDPQDDPEARIRELEQPLSDVARTSELGTAAPSSGEYPYPLPPPPPYPPPPPAYPPPPASWPYDAGNPATAQWPYDSSEPPTTQWPYGTGQQPLPPSVASGGRAAWLIGGVAAVVGLAIAGGIAAFLLTNSSIPGTPGNRPTINGGGGTLRTTPSSTVDFPSPSIAATDSAPPSTLPPGGTFSVSGVGANKTIACDGSIVNVSGVSNTVVITGHCASLIVSGIENVITIDTADSIGVSGFDNRITYHSGTPNLSNSGGSNTVEQG
jgi:hypothetical protein